MDRLTAFVAIAHARLRLEIIERNPAILEATDMPLDIRRPMELAALKGRLARARQAEAAIAVTGARYDKALDEIDELHAAAQGHVGSLESTAYELRRTIEGMVAGDNGGPNELPESSGGSSGGSGQVISSSTGEQG